MTIKHKDAPEHWDNKPHVEDKEGWEEFITIVKMLYPGISDFGINQAIKALRLYLSGMVPTPTVYDASERLTKYKWNRYGPTMMIHCTVATIYEWLTGQEIIAQNITPERVEDIEEKQ